MRLAPPSCSITSQLCRQPGSRTATRYYCCRFSPAFRLLPRSARDFWWTAMVPLAMLMLALASGLPAFGSGIAISVLYALSLGGAHGSQQAINAAGYARYFGRDHF